MRPDADFVRDIVDASQRIERRLAERRLNDFLADDVLQDAIMLQIAVIGNAARALSDEFRGGFPDISWDEIWGMRNLIVHTYHRASPRIVWDTAQVDVPRLARRMKDWLQEHSDEAG
jgi:uncharacterized protein with HEPN domain